MNKKRILTGDRPTGPLHLGHYVGSLKNRIKLQDEYDEYDEFVIIADVQALTDNFANPEKVHINVLEVAKDYLAIGIDPNKSTIFIQSQIPEIAELAVYFMNLVTVAKLERNPTVKTEIKEKGLAKSLPVGFFTYPIHQASDIAIFKADLVPVGADQLPMIEQTVEIVHKFNTLYGDILVEPKPLVSDIPRLIGLDGDAKMSKSLGNFIALGEPAESLKKKVMSMFTDPNRTSADVSGKVEGNPVFIYHDAFNENKDEVADLKNRYQAGRVGDVEVKEKLYLALEKFISPIREKRASLKDKEVMDIILDGTKRARIVAQETMKEVKEAMKINY